MTKKKSRLLNGYEHIAFEQPFHYDAAEMQQRSDSYYEWMDQRRSVRLFSSSPVPRSVIEKLIRSASTAPSGAHK